MTATRQPVACACCGWTGKRATGQPVTCPKCGSWAAFQWVPDVRTNLPEIKFQETNP